MNFQTMSKQRKFVLISSAVGFISMFLPWVSISMFGYSQNVNGMHDKGLLVFLCFVVSGVIAWLGDQTKNAGETMWTVTLLAGSIAFLIILWFYSQASGSIMGGSIIGYGFYIAALAAIGIIASAYFFKSPTDNIKDGFNSIKRNIESKMSNRGSASTSTTIPPTFTAPPGETISNTENMNPPL